MPSSGADAGSIDYIGWIHRVVGWDAVLPIVVSAGSFAIAEMFRQQPPTDILAMVGLPVLAFLIRFWAGRRHILTNHCGETVQWFQSAALMFAIFLLAIVDSFVALLAFLPNGVALPPRDQLVLCVIPLTIYATLVAFAMYPGRRSAEV